MGDDIGGICIFKLKGRARELVVTADRGGGPTSLKASRVFYDLFVNAQGDLGHRRVVLTRRVLNPKRAASIDEVQTSVRAFEMDILDSESLMKTRLEDPMKIEGLLKILPPLIYEATISQNNLEHSYNVMREYVFHQVGRRQQHGQDIGLPQWTAGSAGDKNGVAPPPMDY